MVIIDQSSIILTVFLTDWMSDRDNLRRFLLEAKDARDAAAAQPKLMLPSTVFATDAEEEEVVI